MLYYQDSRRDTEDRGDLVDKILFVTWILSDLAIDVIGLLFWSALGLCLVRTIN